MLAVVVLLTPSNPTAQCGHGETMVWASLVMPVTTSIAVVPRACEPALVAPAGAERFTSSVRPAGMAEPMLAVILAAVWFVVTAHVAPAVALVGALPAVAVLITSDGLPLNAIWFMAST